MSKNILQKLKPISLFLVLILMSQISFGQFREEMATLETMYESRARSVINTVLAPQDYSIVVAVDIDRDQNRLDKIQEEFEKDLLPGMPGGINAENPAIANQLYEIKNKIDIHLILSKKVTKDKEDTLMSLLKMKLHLDDKNGDTLTASRADLPVANPEAVTSKLPELSWKMWGMLIVLFLLALSGLFYYLSKKPEKKEAHDKKDEAVEAKPEVPGAPEVVATDKSSQVEVDPAEILFEQKRQIISLANKYPEATAQALTEHFQKGNERDVLLICEAFGWENSKKLFASLSPRIWGRMGHLVLAKQNKASYAEVAKSFDNCNKTILKKFLEIGIEDTKNPFGFMWKLDNYDLKKVLKGESAETVSLICAHATKDQLMLIMESLDSVMQEAVTIAISKMHTFNHQQVKMTSDLLINKLKALNENKESQADGISLVADLLRSLPAEKEYSFFEKILFESPQDADRIRRVILMYPDLVCIPEEVISEASAMLDMNIIVSALRGNFPEVTEHVLKALPPKKSIMIRNDLAQSSLVSDKQIAMSQRELVITISALLKAKNIELVQLLPVSDYPEQSDKQNVGIEAA